MLAATWLPAQDTERLIPIRELSRRFDGIQAEVDRLKKSGDRKAAGELAAELKALKGRLEGPYPKPKSDEPELHVVTIAKGTAAPAGVLNDEKRITTGYAEVKITYTARPIILVLGAREPVLWKVKPVEGVRFHAVILTGFKTQKVIGLPEHTLVLRRITRAGSSDRHYWAGSYPGQLFDKLNANLRRLTGRDIATFTGLDKPIERRMVVGPENDYWRRQHVLVDVRKLHERATRFRRAQRLAAVRKLRFQAIHYLQIDSDDSYSEQQGASIGEHSVLGPIISTLRPAASNGLYHELYDEKEKIHFALKHYGLQRFDAVTMEPTRVPGGLDMIRREMTSLTIDTRRRRLLMSAAYEPKGLIAYDLKEKSWSRVLNLDHNVSALTYVPGKDVIYAISRSWQGRDTAIYKYAPDGRQLAIFHPAQPINTYPAGYGVVQLIHRDGKLMVLVPPEKDAHGRYINRIYVLDAKSGEILYSGVSQPHDGNGPPRHDLAKPPPAGGGFLDRLDKGFAAARGVARRLEERGEKDRAEKLRKRIAALRVQMREGKEEASDEPEIHVVSGDYADGTVVEIAQTPHPVILVMCAYRGSHWTLKVADDVKLNRVILAGANRQTVSGVPKGVRVDNYNREDRTGGFYTNKIGGSGYDYVWKQLEKLTGKTKGTLQITSQNQTEPVRIGPRSSEWRIWRVVDRLDEIARIGANDAEQNRVAALRKIRFSAQFQRHRNVKVAGPRRPVGRAREPQSPPVEFGEFTIDGPVHHSLVPVAAGVKEVVSDGQGEMWYGRSRSGLVQIDAKTGKLSEIAPDPALPEFSSLGAMAYDTKRRRVLMLGGKYLYAYATDTKKWSVMRRPGFRFATLMVYDEYADRVYTTSFGQFGRSRIAVYNPHGVLLRQVPISAYMARLPEHPYLPKVQIRCLDGYLAILHGVYSKETPTDFPQYIHVVDLKDGRVVYTGSLRPHATYEKLADGEFKKLWIALGTADDAQADKLTWRLAAGQADTVKYLRKQLAQTGAVDAKQLKQLIAALGDDRFIVREAAQRKLAEIGSVLEGDLRKARQGASPEIRLRIDSLLKQWENAKTDPGTLREQRTMQTLERIGTPEAVKLLEELATGASTSRRARAAQAALKRMGKQR